MKDIERVLKEVSIVFIVVLFIIDERERESKYYVSICVTRQLN